MKRLSTLAFFALLLPLQAALASPDVTRAHFQLSKSSPAADAAVPSPTEVRLWFSQEPQNGTTSIRVLDAAEKPLHTGDVVRDAQDGKVHSVALHGRLAPGRYTVAWRAMGQDGHVVRGDFSFTVTAGR